MRIHVLRHASFESEAFIADWAEGRGYTLSRSDLWKPGASGNLPDPADIDMVVAMGGPQSVGDEVEYPWLVREKRFLREVVDAGLPVLGICLGAQLLADVLGAAVYPCEAEEIGWHPVEITGSCETHPLFSAFPSRFVTFQWHGDTFEIPEGALSCAASQVCSNQAFVWEDRVVGLQFHPEMRPESVEALLAEFGHTLAQRGEWVQSEAAIRSADAYYDSNNRWLAVLLDKLAAVKTKKGNV